MLTHIRPYYWGGDPLALMETALFRLITITAYDGHCPRKVLKELV